MAKISKWDVLDGCSHTEWKTVATLARELSATHSTHVTLAEIYLHLEGLKEAGFVETEVRERRRHFRKTSSGIQARQEARSAEGTQVVDGTLKPA